MKRAILSVVLIACAVALASAQDNDRRGQGRYPGGPPSRQRDFSQNRPPKPENVSINGNLAIVKGRIAVVSGDVTYFAGGLQRFVGFIDGLKEGAAVSLEGNAFTFPQNEKAKFLQVQKMTLNGKEYDLGGFRPAPGQMQHRPPMYQQQGRPNNRGFAPYNNHNQFQKHRQPAPPKHKSK